VTNAPAKRRVLHIDCDESDEEMSNPEAKHDDEAGDSDTQMTPRDGDGMVVALHLRQFENTHAHTHTCTHTENNM